MAKKQITRGKLGSLRFQINPTELSRSTGGVLNEVSSPNTRKPIVVYGGGSNKVISFELYLNTRHQNKLQTNIKKYIETFENYSEKGEVVVFTYMGESRKVLIESVDTTILGMNNNTITEATISLSLREFT